MHRVKETTKMRAYGKKRSLLLIVLLFAGLLLGSGTFNLCYGGPTEPQIKAAFIYNFIKFVEWPQRSFQRADSPVSVCAIGDDPLVNTLDSLNGRSAQGRTIAVKRINKTADAEKCHVIYIAKSEKDQTAAMLKPTRAGLLSVGDTKSFPAMGGIINFLLSENRVTFEINMDAAERAELKISSQILKLATIYHENGLKEEK